MTTKALPCAHWDRIESPKGPISKARCKKCGRERVYDTSKFYEYNVTETLRPRNDGLLVGAVKGEKA